MSEDVIQSIDIPVLDIRFTSAMEASMRETLYGLTKLVALPAATVAPTATGASIMSRHATLRVTFPTGMASWRIGVDRASSLENPHTWLKPDGMADYIRIMRGEQKLPHLQNCEECAKMFRMQLEALDAKGIKPSFGKRKNPGRRKLTARRAIVRTLLRSVAMIESASEVLLGETA